MKKPVKRSCSPALNATQGWDSTVQTTMRSPNAQALITAKVRGYWNGWVGH
jgi:hypothetical protein